MINFSEMPLSAAMQQRLAQSNFCNPTPIQAETLPHALAGKDLIATAPTGTGKTLAFVVPIVERLAASPASRHVEALVLVPTRELAMQIHEQFEQLRGKSIPPAALVMGGMPELRHLLRAEKGRTLVFARTKRGTERLAKHLERDGFLIEMIHGDRTQSQRTGALDAFDQGRCKVLVATDVAARGLDIESVAHVINYDLPTLAEDFIH